MSTYVDKPLSLIERKKLQWAKEKGKKIFFKKTNF